MTNANVLTTLVTVIGKNAGIAVANTLSCGISGAIVDSIRDIQDQTRATNDTIYYLQVKTFLETTELNQEEVNNFFVNNADNQRLGAEVFKILEQTYIDKQSQMLAKAFQLYVKNIIKKPKFDQLVYIITNLNQHLINKLDAYLPDDAITSKEFELEQQSIGFETLFGETEKYSKEELAYDRRIWSFFGKKEKNIPQEFVNFEFYKPEEMPLSACLETIPQTEYKPTRFFLWFITRIFLDNPNRG